MNAPAIIDTLTPLVPGAEYEVGASVDFALGTHFGLGVQGRWSSAKAELAAGEGTVKIDAGGLDVAFGVRIYF